MMMNFICWKLFLSFFLSSNVPLLVNFFFLLFPIHRFFTVFSTVSNAKIEAETRLKPKQDVAMKIPYSSSQ